MAFKLSSLRLSTEAVRPGSPELRKRLDLRLADFRDLTAKILLSRGPSGRGQAMSYSVLGDAVLLTAREFWGDQAEESAEYLALVRRVRRQVHAANMLVEEALGAQFRVEYGRLYAPTRLPPAPVGARSPRKKTERPRDITLRDLLADGLVPGETIPWGTFHGLVLKRCDATEKTRGFGFRTIERRVAELRAIQVK
jgi:hypothetical protein